MYLKDLQVKANCSEDVSPQDGLRDAWIWDVWQTAGMNCMLPNFPQEHFVTPTM